MRWLGERWWGVMDMSSQHGTKCTQEHGTLQSLSVQFAAGKITTACPPRITISTYDTHLPSISTTVFLSDEFKSPSSWGAETGVDLVGDRPVCLAVAAVR